MKKTIKHICLFLAIGISSELNSQTTWYFGNEGGCRFTSAGVVAAAPPHIIPYFNTGEGSSVLVDASNNVIMYTDGLTLWNGVGAVQGVANMLDGNSSSTQSAVIVPIPSTSSSSTTQKAFIFTVTSAESAYGNGTAKYGLRVSLASIAGTAPNCTINILASDLNVLLTPATDLMGEQLTVTNFVVDNNGVGGYWVLTHGIGGFRGSPTAINGIVNNTSMPQPGERSFFAYHVTCATTSISLLDATEKESAIPVGAISEHRSWSHPAGNDMNLAGAFQLNSQSQLKFSPSATKIAVTLPWAGNTVGTTGCIPNPSCQLFDFNTTTGVVGAATALQFMLGFNNVDNLTKDGAAYGLEFSPNENYIYVSSCYASGHLGASITTRVYRYTITTLIAGTISSSKVVVPGSVFAGVNGTVGGSFAAMEMGPDNKIYIARVGASSLTVIGDPNNPSVSACSFGVNVIPMAGSCLDGLPTTVLTATTSSVPHIASVSACSGSLITAIGSYTGEIPSRYYWEIYGSDNSGNPVNSSGGIVSPTTASWYDYNQWFYGTTPGTFAFPGSNTLPCGKYYTVKLALSDGCGEWVATQFTIYLNCTPTPIISTPPVLCYGDNTNLCVTNYTAGGSHPVTYIAWINPLASSPTCINVSPTTTTTYPVWVTQNGCTGTASTTVNVTPNYTNFSLTSSLSPVTSPYYTAIATPTIDPGTVSPSVGLGFYWEVEEIDLVTGALISGTDVYDPFCWHSPSSVNNFVAYDYTTYYIPADNSGAAFNPGCAITTVGHFQAGHKYRITYATWTAACPWTEMQATIFMCNGCRTNEPEIQYGEVTTENTTLHGAQYQASLQHREIDIFPNPSNGMFTLNLPGGNEKNIVVYDVMGNVVFEKNSTTDETLNLDLTDKAEGVYLVKINSNGEIISKKIIKQ